tara:strand:- start:5267 stop:5857 length:591 start_codon:yes stop_codon:yes gene_type:complete
MELVENINKLIEETIDSFKKDKKNDINSFKNIFKLYFDTTSKTSEEMVIAIYNLTINDLVIGKTHYTKKSGLTMEDFRKNEMYLRVASEERATNKNKIDSLLQLIAQKDNINNIPKRLTNINCFSAYLDRLVTERIKKYNFNLDNRESDVKHQIFLSKLIMEEINNMFDEIKINGYHYVGEKRSFDPQIKGLEIAK